MIALGTGSGTSNEPTETLASLLGVLSDPAATKERLQALIEKTEEAKKLAEQIQADKAEIAALHKEVEEKKADIEQSHDKLTKREDKLSKQQQIITTQREELKAAKEELTEARYAFDERIVSKSAEHAERERSLAVLEKNANDLATNAAATVESQIAERKAELEAEYKKKLETASAMSEEAVKKHNEAVSMTETAEQQKLFYETRVAALRKALGEVT